MDNHWTESNGTFVYTWQDFQIRRVPTASSYLGISTGSSGIAPVWRATRNGEFIYQHRNLDDVKCYCESL